jgi:hypothetical protein
MRLTCADLLPISDTSADLPSISAGPAAFRPLAALAVASGRHARLVRIVLKGAQDLPQPLLSTLHGFIAAKARNFEMLILKYFNLNSFPDQSHIQS